MRTKFIKKIQKKVVIILLLLCLIFISALGAIITYAFGMKTLSFSQKILSILFTISTLTLILLATFLCFALYIPLPSTNESEISNFLKEDYNSKHVIKEHKVENFNVYKNTIPMLNVGSPTNRNGNCKGFAIMEKLVFSEDVSKLKKLSHNEIDLTGISKDLSSYESILNKPKGYQSEEAIKILNALDYLQINYSIVYKPTAIGEYSCKTRDNAVNFIASQYIQNKFSTNQSSYKNVNIDLKFDIKNLIHRLDKDEPLVMSFSSGSVGHAVLAYKYEQLSNDEFKIYVADSNYPFMESNKNAHSENYFYIVFKKIEGRWEYKYAPHYEVVKGTDISIYNEEYNSFVKNAALCIF